ncbi:MAG TPA: AAA family ATPase [Anaerolineales bacterium]|nr:AAA family ATPase [Anaerolineales bacterium]
MEKPVIGTLLNAYSTFGHFELAAYYSICFGIVPSSLKIDLPFERSKEEIDSVLQYMDLPQLGFITVFKHWIADDAKNTKPFEDLAVEYLFKSESKRMLVQFTCQVNGFDVRFLYDIDQPESEKWVLETSQRLQKEYRAATTPKFKVLIQQDGMFTTEDVEIANFNAIDIHELYNDDFLEMDAIITESMQKQESGMVLLHGEPGTGKTTYIKHLICKYQNKQFIFIQNDFVKDLLKPSFISFLLQNKNAILIIEDAEKVVVSRADSSDDSVVSTILQLTDGLFSDFLNIKIICTFNTNIDHIDKALLRKGRMIAKYNFTPLSVEKTAALAKKLGHDDVRSSLTLADIFGLDKRGFDKAVKRTIGFSV